MVAHALADMYSIGTVPVCSFCTQRVHRKNNEREARRTAVTTRLLDSQSEHLLRELAPQVLGAVIRRFRDFAAAEDAVQEALIAAAVQWPREGLPANPRGWLIQVASRRMTDYQRSELARRRRETEFATQSGEQAAGAGVWKMTRIRMTC